MTKKVQYETRPSLLVSYVFLDMFFDARGAYDIRDWTLDSGAFTAWSTGKAIDLEAYIDKCLELIATEKNLVEIFSLDVISDKKAGITPEKAAEQSLKNTERMWEAGVPAIPTFHIGEPEEFLFHIAKHYPKIALGGIVGLPPTKKKEFVKECFARVWPKPIHGFGIVSRDMILGFPFHSTDATNWELQPCGFGNWKAFGGKMSVRGSTQNLRAEVEHYLRLEREAQRRWEKEMKKLEVMWAANGFDSDDKKRPDVKLSVLPTGQELKALAPVDKKRPDIKLVSARQREGTTREDRAFAPRGRGKGRKIK